MPPMVPRGMFMAAALPVSVGDDEESDPVADADESPSSVEVADADESSCESESPVEAAVESRHGQQLSSVTCMKHSTNQSQKHCRSQYR